MKASSKEIINIGKLAKEIKKNYSEGNEKLAYDILNELNSKLSDLCGQILHMEEVLSI